MYALLEEQVGEVRKVMVYESESGAYVFLFNTQEDKSCIADLWFETLGDAVEHCLQEFNVKQEQWLVINDPKEGNHDVIH
ncbi:hypothetical protein R70723_23895 [Paenibacillus sp. FSL R7-0273]|uniref:hypothetical protein n=1 Tax=Paenibacillus sp. FSL R7-0273 TaxID=1536772 RepID=UPI0004F73224|nr:hypothetical protein [Paenibacillus sp. FSL R7-0273]AIQ48610.1 hypothetical protein R70723_23895 [Paenibacillus sp. FSL R7-0273]OMF94045.1 hypothetical protein BK144_10675 [Paenibacillus sp. FSL R7-0273]